MNDAKTMLNISDGRLAALCRQYHVRKLSLFGSVLREDFRSDSDIDVLVEFEPEARIGLSFITLQAEFSDLFGRPVDLEYSGVLKPPFSGQSDPYGAGDL